MHSQEELRGSRFLPLADTEQLCIQENQMQIICSEVYGRVVNYLSAEIMLQHTHTKALDKIWESYWIKALQGISLQSLSEY